MVLIKSKLIVLVVNRGYPKLQISHYASIKLMNFYPVTTANYSTTTNSSGLY